VSKSSARGGGQQFRATSAATRNRPRRDASGRAGNPLSQIQNDMRRDFYLSAHEAVQYGLIDKVLIPQRKGAGGTLSLGSGL